MYTDKDLKEIDKLKRDIEVKISSIISNFNLETSLSVKDIDFEFVDVTGVGDKNKKYFLSGIKVEIAGENISFSKEDVLYPYR